MGKVSLVILARKMFDKLFTIFGVARLASKLSQIKLLEKVFMIFLIAILGIIK